MKAIIFGTLSAMLSDGARVVGMILSISLESFFPK